MATHATQTDTPVETLHSETGLTITVTRSETDGVLLVFIDGADGHDAGDGTAGLENEQGPILRVNLNDAPIYENPPFPAA